MTLGARLRESWAALTGTTSSVQARVIPLWQAGRPLPSPSDIQKLTDEGYRQNTLIAGCIWAIATSASEPTLVVERKKRDGTIESAIGFDADNLRALLEKPNPEQTTFTFLEQLFTHQQISGNWFCRKIRASAGNVVHLWPLNPARITIVPGANGWVKEYRFGNEKMPYPAEDVVHDALHPDPNDDFWGLSPIAVASRFIDLDNQASDWLRAYFLNNATPAGLLKLKARMPSEERKRIQELWTKDHSGLAGWHSVSVLDADAEYQEIGTSPGEKMRLDAIFNETEARLCMAFGVPAIVVQAVIGLNRSTYANYAEARRSFWLDTLVTLYKRCAQRLTDGVAKEFAADLCIRFDLSTVEALREQHDSRRKFAIDGWNAGLLTLNQALELIGLPPAVDVTVGEARKAASAPPSGFEGLLFRQGVREQHRRTLTPAEKKALARFRRVAQEHFRAQGHALVKHLED